MPSFQVEEEETPLPTPTSTTTATAAATATTTPITTTPKEFVPPRPSTAKESSLGPKVDISPDNDGGVIKQLKRASTQVPLVLPQMGDQVTIHYVAMYGDDGVLFDSSRKLMNSGGFSFKLGSSEPMKEGMLRPKGLDLAITQMHVGECALLTLQPEYAFGKLGVRQPPRPGHTVPPNTFVVYNVDVLECGKAVGRCWFFMLEQTPMVVDCEVGTCGTDFFCFFVFIVSLCLV